MNRQAGATEGEGEITEEMARAGSAPLLASECFLDCRWTAEDIASEVFRAMVKYENRRKEDESRCELLCEDAQNTLIVIDMGGGHG